MFMVYQTKMVKYIHRLNNEEPRGKLLQGMLEMSNVELAKELSKLIESQKAYQLSLKMIQTSDEIEQLECELRR